MSHHVETNPYFIRPLQQREGQHSQPPPLSPPPQQNQPPAPRPKKHQGQRSKPYGLWVGKPRQGVAAPPQRDENQGLDYGPGMLSTPLPDDHRGPQLTKLKQKSREHPKPPGPRPTEHQGQRSKPYGPREVPESDVKFRSPWMLPHHDEDHGGHVPRHDGVEYRSPWILPHQQQDKDQPQSPQRPKDQDHHPLHPQIPPGQQQEDRSRRHRHSHGLRAPPPQKTRPITWLFAALCAIFWIVIFLGGLVVLIVYLVYRPRSPRFDVSSVTLNSAYIDAGALLNADISLLANFTNPNKKVGVDFNHMIIDLYYGNTLIATQYIESFTAARAESTFANIHMITSQVRLPLGDSAHLQDQISRNGVIFNVKGVFRVKYNLGGFLRYSYRLYGHCAIMVTAPPSGVLKASRCRTKR